ncbi:MAG: TetR/AcrR family transcriptional regulator [Proteobacteria bacterium]|nr:MAG: TetR/AcrR family transcriptional regulator [Pseudomonadota bacterium]
MPASPLLPSLDSPHRRKGEQTAERILDAAEALFAERGYAGTSLRDVAARVELRIPSLYNHFPSKDALYAAVLARGIGPVLELLAGFAAAPSESRDAGAVIERVMAILRRHRNLPKLIQHETLAGGPRLTPMLREWIAPVFGRAGEMAETAPGAGRWAPEQLPLVVIAVYNVLVGFFTFAPLYQALNGDDLLTDARLDHQTRILREVVAALFPEVPIER